MKSDWKSPNDVKQTYVNASILKDNRIVFNIKGNSYRLVAKFNFEKQWIFIRFIGTHAAYNKKMLTQFKTNYIMNINPIKSESDYRNSLKRMEVIFDAAIGTIESEEADILAMMIDEYKKTLSYRNTIPN